ncbi:DMT family transporter [Algiphilus sp.]|uniref:DMT family transporter n=1 Tax=Algiphilus sp. TaxID=1872431 RepID=UPI003C3EA8EB
MTPAARYAILSGAFVLLWNSGFIGAEYGLPYAGPLTLLFWRYLALTAVLLAWVALFVRPLWPGRVEALHATWTGILAHAVWLGCALGAIAVEVPAGIVALVVALQPLLTGALSGAVTGEGTSPLQWTGLTAGFCGVAIAVVARIQAGGDAPVWGYLLPFGSVVAITIASLAQRLRAHSGQALPMATLLLYQCGGSALALMLPAWWMEDFATQWTPPFIAALGWVTFAVSLGAYALMWRLLALADATRVASLFYFGPPVTMVMAWLAFGDAVIATDWVALAVTALGVVLVQWRPSRPASAH